MSSSDIPNVEERMSLEEYRRMVLQGLNLKVPEEYESLRRRYFEELIQNKPNILNSNIAYSDSDITQ